MGTIYNKLPEDLQIRIDSKIKDNIKSYVINSVLDKIKEKRKDKLKLFLNMQGKKLLYSFYYWIVIPDRDDPVWVSGHNSRSKYKNFFMRLFPTISDLSTISKVYDHYYSITNGSVESFINLCIDNITIEEAEDLYNYTVFTFYLTKINYSPLILRKR